MADPKSRKVIIVENPLLSTRVKDIIVRVLFDNLQVRVIAVRVRTSAHIAIDRSLQSVSHLLHYSL